MTPVVVPQVFHQEDVATQQLKKRSHLDLFDTVVTKSTSSGLVFVYLTPFKYDAVFAGDRRIAVAPS